MRRLKTTTVVVLVLAFKACIGSSIAETSSFPSPASSTSNRYYAETSFKADWVGALQHCHSQGRRLATIESWEDNNQVLQVIGQTNLRSGHFWTAGTDQYGSGWIWETTKKPFTFTYWNLMQPNNYIMRNQHCMGYWEISTIIARGYKWNDKDCKYKGYFICEDFNEKTLNNSARIV